MTITSHSECDIPFPVDALARARESIVTYALALDGLNADTADNRLRFHELIGRHHNGQFWDLDRPFHVTKDATGNYHVFSGITGVGNSVDLDDIYIKNEAGYEGDIRVKAAYPSGDGGTLMWTPQSGGSHFAMVDTHPVDLTKWLETATPNDIDLWTNDQPKNHYRCPSCARTVQRIAGKPKILRNGFILPGKITLREVTPHCGVTERESCHS